MKSSNHVLGELTALIASALPEVELARELYRPDDIAGYIAWELFHALHSQGAYLKPALTGMTRATSVYTDLMKTIGLIDEKRNITPQGMQHYHSLVSFYTKSAKYSNNY